VLNGEALDGDPRSRDFRRRSDEPHRFGFAGGDGREQFEQAGGMLRMAGEAGRV
jgi:hypothetical protein